MTMIRDWQGMRSMCDRLLKERTGEDLEAWIRRMSGLFPGDEKGFRVWLRERGVTGFIQSYLVMEQFGFPELPVATPEELVDGQYADRPRLRAILDSILDAAAKFGEVTVRARRTHVVLVSPRRTFARVEATPDDRVIVGLRLEGMRPEGRLQPSRIEESLPLQVSLGTQAEFDAEALGWLQQAYVENC